MKKLILIGVFGIFSNIYANINAVVSVLPQKTFLKAIGGDKVNIALMVKPGNSPHTYEPKPSQMIDINNADIYFAIGIEFEKVWLPKFINQNKNMKIANLDKDIVKMQMKKHLHDDENGEDKHHDNHRHEQITKDPHIWTSPDNVKVIAKNILKHLIKIDKINSFYYEQNYKNFINKVNKTNKEIKNILQNTAVGSKFMVFHPAWGYFASQYNLVQLPIEIEGKSPKLKTIKYIIEEAREENIKAIFTAPEFSTKIAKQIASELGIKVIKVSPLNPNWSKNLLKLTRAIAGK